MGVYREKRRALVARGVHVVEIDLLFRGARTKLSKPLPPGDYYVMTFRADRRPDVDVYSWKLRDPMPQIPIPLKGPGESVNLDLGGALESAFERADYDRKLKYRSPLPMTLGTSDAQWVEEMLRKAGKRTA